MKRLFFVTTLAALSIAAPASASHFLNLNVPYDSRGACQAAVADFNIDDRERLLDTFPEFFDSLGDVESFLNRAFSCEIDAASDQWFIKDGRGAVLSSDWYLRRHD
jgi:hypothetical protein